VVSVIIPAHDEARVIGRLLDGLTPPDDSGPGMRLIVVCNGCTDDTARIAGGYPGVQVLQTPEPSKREALRIGDETAGDDFPRVYIDADVEIDRTGVLALTEVLDDPAVLASAPERDIPREHSALSVRWYYDVWERLPSVRAGLFGRGVIALSAHGHRRVSHLPRMMSDDLAMSSAFTDTERIIVPSARVTVHPPRTWGDLLRRRTRAATGTAQAYQGQTRLPTDSRTSTTDLRRLLATSPALAPKVAVFVLVALLARRRASAAIRDADFTTWLRDESSRAN
jgi:cellulose synthase/poly-beta-1,6-N-acetylglucosamine synthase-like glycosyltransferase